MNEYVGKKVPGAEPAKGAYRTQQPGKMLFSRSVGREIQSPFNAVEVGIAFSFCLFSGMRECLVRSEVAPPICLPAGCRQARGRKRLKNIPLAVFCRPPGNLGKSHGSNGERVLLFSSSFFCPWAVALFTVQDPSVSFARTRGGPQRDRRRRRLLRRPLPEWREEDDKRPFLLLLFLSRSLRSLSPPLFLLPLSLFWKKSCEGIADVSGKVSLGSGLRLSSGAESFQSSFVVLVN